jgi:NAD(P)-dependent dehydrogenase (short-subunit alcohol dehydrogenase family)
MVAQGHIPSQLGKTVVITGATGGLGYETALALAKAGAEVVLTGRDDRKGQLAIEKISREASGARIVFESLDPARLQSIADFAQRMRSRQSLDLLINNAGVMAQPRRQVTADGFEMQFGTNHLGHFAHYCVGQAAQESSASAVWRTGPSSSISMICKASAYTLRGRPTGNPNSPVWYSRLNCNDGETRPAGT